MKARTRIQKIGKAQREPATKYAKEVKAYEDELLAILAPEEERMKTLEKAAKEHAMREERMKTLPEYVAKLQSIGDGIEAEQDFLLSLDPNQRDQYYNERLAAKNESDRAAIEAEKQQAEAAKRAEQEKVIAKRREILIEAGFATDVNGLSFDTNEAVITITNDDIAKMTESEFLEKADFWRKIIEAKKADDIKATEERAKEEERKAQEQRAAAEEEARRVAEENERKAKEEAERKAQEEERSRRSSEAYQNWLSDSSYNEATDIIQENEGVYTLYRTVSTYKPEAFGFSPKDGV